MGAFGIFFFIISAVPLIIFQGIVHASPNMGGGLSNFFVVIGLILLFLLLAGGLGMLIFSGLQGREYSYIWKEGTRLDFSAQEYVRTQFAEYRTMHTVLIVIGIVLIVISALPAAILIYINNTNLFFTALSGAVGLFLIGVAIFLFVLAGRQRSGLNRLLKLQHRAKMAQARFEAEGGQQGGHPNGQQAASTPRETIIYDNEILAKFMPVYWPTITAFYLIVSFLTFHWGTTWIIWPIAAIVHAVISKSFGKHIFES